jgi:hypothetical protein
MGKQYIMTIRTNLLGVQAYSSNPAICELLKLDGPHGESDGDRHYRVTAFRTGTIDMTLQDMHLTNVVKSSHRVTL